MESATFESGANRVKNPHRVLRDIEQESDLTADLYGARPVEWDCRGATDGPAFVACHVARDARTLDAGRGTGRSAPCSQPAATAT